MFEREKYTLEDINDILTNAIIMNNTDFSFFCDGKLTMYLEEVLDANFGLVDEDFDEYILDEEVYSVSGLQLSDEYRIFIEKVFTEEGIMKLHESDGTAYIFTNKLTINQIINNIKADEIILCEIDENEDYNVECNDEFEDGRSCSKCQFENDLSDAISDAIEITSNNSACFDCKVDAILEVSSVLINAIRDGILGFEE